MRYAIRHPCPALEPNGELVQLVHIYVSFPGTTEEALRYYEKVFGTRIVALQTFGDIRAVSTGEQLPYLDRRQRQGQADRAFDLLSAGGKVHMLLANAPWGPTSGCASTASAFSG